MKLYALVLENGEQLTPAAVREHYPNYGHSGLYGWRAPKKVYYTLGHLHGAYTQLPDKIKKIVKMQVFEPVGDLVDLTEYAEKAGKKKNLKRLGSRINIAKRVLESYNRQLQVAHTEKEVLKLQAMIDNCVKEIHDLEWEKKSVA